MALLSIQNLCVNFGGPDLLHDATLNIERGDRLCIVGRNGEGKSTLLRVLAGELPADRGSIARQGGLRLGFLPQEVPASLPGTVHDVVVAARPDHSHDPQAALQVDKVISRMHLDPDAVFSTLSGGQKRRALLARALVMEPDILLLDEPTNHLDIASIQWMERFLIRYPGAILFVTHDRAFLQALATRIVELDRGRLTTWDCDWRRYLERREVLLAAEEKQNAVFDKKLAKEEVWIRQGVKARRTRNEGRVRALERLREERRQRRNLVGNATLRLQEAAITGRKVIEVKQLHHAFPGLTVVQDFSSTILRGDKIGLIGPNGCGKTTLLRLLLKQEAPQSGSVEHGTGVELLYYDQHREALDENKTLMENVAEGNDFVTFQGRRRHVLSYLEDFLFSPERARTPVRVLSGGERNRLMLAKLFTRPGNLLVLDEPTNDLDIETLELLEALLVEFDGTLLLVSHDREFLNRVVTTTFAFEGEGQIGEYPGGYDDWEAQRPKTPSAFEKSDKTGPRPKRNPLKNKEREELAALPLRIEVLEKELETLLADMASPDFFQRAPDLIARSTARSEAIPHELEQAFARWQELDARK